MSVFFKGTQVILLPPRLNSSKNIFPQIQMVDLRKVMRIGIKGEKFVVSHHPHSIDILD
jgi:hypothetical protein